jgi:hypothetical protein
MWGSTAARCTCIHARHEQMQAAMSSVQLPSIMMCSSAVYMA